jgi:prepilin-type N-terminal cleavage/methylation domain-containing protein
MRRAFTLIEMITAMSVGTVLMGVAVSVLIVLLGAEQSGRTHFQRSESLRRLADQFRRDVHAAVGETAAGPEDRPGRRFSLADNASVQYAIDADRVSREQRIGAKVVRRESYTLPKGSTATIAVDRTTSPWMLSLTIMPKEPAMRPGREVRIDALLGRDHRFAERQKEGK